MPAPCSPFAQPRYPRPFIDSTEVHVSGSASLSAAVAAVDPRGNPLVGVQCRFDPDLHTGPDAEESPEERAARELVAAEVCESCPLRAECLEAAVQLRPEYGVWAGFTSVQLAGLFAAYDMTEAA